MNNEKFIEFYAKEFPKIEFLLESYGFEKRLNFKKKKNGVSKYSWFAGNTECFSIEKCLGSDIDEHWYVTITIDGSKIHIHSVKWLKDIIEVLFSGFLI